MPNFGRGVLVALLLLIGAGRACAQEVFAIDQRFGEIDFRVSHLGLFDTTGHFARFHGDLTIDATAPEKSGIAVEIDAGSVEMPWANEVDLLRSPPYFDVVAHPAARFASTRIAADGPNRFLVAGSLDLRGVTQPMMLHAVLTGRHHDAQGDVADFIVTGAIRRSAFGMTTDQSFISDRVELIIHARVILTAAAHAQ